MQSRSKTVARQTEPMTNPPARSQPTQLLVLDPATLGRPVHLLPAFCGLFRDDLNEALATAVNRRYGAQVVVTEAVMEPLTRRAYPKRWLTFETPDARLGCHPERALTLALLAYRYKLKSRGQPPDTSAPETATEERVGQLFAQQLILVLARRLSAGLQPVDQPPADSGQQPPKRLGHMTPAEGSWALRATVRISEEFSAELAFLLGPETVSRLLKAIAPAPASKPKSDGQPLANRLVLNVTARLLQRQIPLGELLALKPGDVIPIRLGPTDILVGQSRLMTAAVAENKGKLCLTSFEDVE